MEDWLADSASSPAVAPPVSSDGNVVDENAHPDDALNKPVLTVTVDGKEGGRTFLLSEARGRSIDCTVKVSGANAQYGATGLRVHYSDKLLLATNHLGRIAVEPGKAVKQLARSNPVEDPTAPAGMKGFFAATAGKANYGIDGTMWTFSFTLSDDVEPEPANQAERKAIEAYDAKVAANQEEQKRLARAVCEAHDMECAANDAMNQAAARCETLEAGVKNAKNENLRAGLMEQLAGARREYALAALKRHSARLLYDPTASMSIENLETLVKMLYGDHAA